MAKRLMAAALAVMVLATASFAAETLPEVTIPNGLAHAKLGDWITFKMADGTQQRHTVIEKTGDTPTSEVVVRIETLVNNQPQDVKRFRQAVGEEFVKPPVPYGETHTYQRRKESITFEGTLLEITILDIMNGGTLVRRRSCLCTGGSRRRSRTARPRSRWSISVSATAISRPIDPA